MMIHSMQHTECTHFVATQRIARLACCHDDRPYVMPMQYVYAEGRFFGFSLPGQKIDLMRLNPHVCLEIDHLTDLHHWTCVIVRGTFHELSDAEERIHGWGVVQKHNDWWEPGAFKPGPAEAISDRTHVFFAIEVDEMSGRHAIGD